MSLLDKINLSNDFMFARVMSDTVVCKAVLEAILGISIEYSLRSRK